MIIHKNIYSILLIAIVLTGTFFLFGCSHFFQKTTNEKNHNYNSSNKNYKPGDYRETIVHDGLQRTYLIHIPKNYNENTTYPLLLSFHGGGGTAENQAKRGFSKKADTLASQHKKSFIVVYPQGINNQWNHGRNVATTHENIDDVGFVRTLIAHVQNTLPIDKKNIFANGMSSGGFFSYRLGCEMSDTFAGIAPVVSAMPKSLLNSCNANSVSLIAIQGTEDPIVPINGGDVKHKTLGIGKGGLTLSSQNTEKFWAKNNKCERMPKTETLPSIMHDGTTVTKTTYTDCAQNTKIHFYRVGGMGHQWPPNENRKKIAGPTSKNINATEVIVDFLMNKKSK
ncbi:MAG: hydrolase [Candidatus Moraniibacteriota bacterium]|nr:MAG: hydrolase [Candidatus Moranbacteria bacterium]